MTSAAPLATRPSRQIDSLQAGRALAALAVVVHHASLAAVSFAGPFAGSSILEAGYLGVDFFFVLSGFIIYHSTRGKDLRTYTASRVRRVYQPYLPVGVGIALLYTLAPQLSAGGRTWSWLPTLTLLPVHAETALSVAWTLKHEIFFYALFAALYFTNRLAIGMAAWAVAIVGASLAGFAAIPLALINLEFIFGILVAVAIDRGGGSRWWYLAALVPFAVWLALGADRVLSPLVGLTFACLILPTVRLERQGHFTVPPWLLLLGAASYAIYLTHGLVVSAVARLAPSMPLILTLGIIASIVAGLAYFRWIETPLLALGSRRRVRPTVTASSPL